MPLEGKDRITSLPSAFMYKATAACAHSRLSTALHYNERAVLSTSQLAVDWDTRPPSDTIRSAERLAADD